MPPWLAALFTRRMLICVFTGFSSGLPLYLLLNLVPAWLRSEGVDLRAIGLFALIQFPYTWKFLWSPFLDRYTPPLGRRRGWMFLTQAGLLGGDCLPRTDQPGGTDCAGLLQAGVVRWAPGRADTRLADRECFPASSRDDCLRSRCSPVGDAGHRTRCLPARDPLRAGAGLGQFGACQCLPHRRTGAGLALADPGRPPALAAGIRHHRAFHAAGHAAGALRARAGGGRRCAEDLARRSGRALPRIHRPRRA
jgi:MFS family permease